MLKKNDKVCVDITDYTDDGLGIGKADTDEGTFTLFIKDTAIGDRVETAVTKLCKGYGYGRLLKVQKPSPDRIQPLCPVASRCGGCTLRHIGYKAQLEWKAKRVSDCMFRIGGLKAGKDYKIYPVAGMEEPERYRNKAQYPVGMKDGSIVTGFFAGRTHSVIPSEDCLIEPEAFGEILKTIKAYAQKKCLSVYDEQSGKGLIRHILIREGMGGSQIMVCIIVNASPGEKCLAVFDGLSEILGKQPEIKTFLLSHNTERTNVILGKKETVLFGDGRIKDRIGTKEYEISARSFYQVNPGQTGVLYEKVRESAKLTGREIVWDLYCGTGTISLFLADRADAVYGVEVVESAVEDAKRNAVLNGTENVYFYCGKAEDIILYDNDPDRPGIFYKCRGTQDDASLQNNKRAEKKTGLPRPDVIVVDPPRKGCDAQLIDTITGSRAVRVVYVSCNPATLARDAALLSKGGYKPVSLQPVDMFPHTTGVECVAVFELSDVF